MGDARCTQHYCWCIQHFKWMSENTLHLSWFVWVIWIKLIRMSHTNQVDPWVIRIVLIHMSHIDELNPYDLYGLTWSVCLNYTYRSSLSVQIIRINHELAYLWHRIILKLTKNAGCTINRVGAPNITLRNFLHCRFWWKNFLQLIRCGIKVPNK